MWTTTIPAKTEEGYAVKANELNLAIGNVVEFVCFHPGKEGTTNQGIFFSYYQVTTLITSLYDTVIQIYAYNSTETNRSERWQTECLYRNQVYS